MTEIITEKILEIINTTDLFIKRLKPFICYKSEDLSIWIKFDFDTRGNLFFYISLINNVGKIIDEEPVEVMKREKIKEKIEILLSRNDVL